MTIPEINPCPSCGENLNASVGIGPTQSPQPGDISLCAYCLRYLVYCDDMTMRVATVGEPSELGMPLVPGDAIGACDAVGTNDQ